jgi:hypothetical protein
MNMPVLCFSALHERNNYAKLSDCNVACTDSFTVYVTLCHHCNVLLSDGG